jgi:hypothetical protein
MMNEFEAQLLSDLSVLKTQMMGAGGGWEYGAYWGAGAADRAA